MLLCRRILFQLEFRRLPHFASIRQAIPSALPSSLSIPPINQNVTKRHLRSRPDASVATLSVQHLWQTLSALSEKNPSHSKPGEDKMREKIKALQAYRHLRILDRPSLTALPLSSYFSLIVRATKQRLDGVLIHLVQDVIELCPESERVSALLTIMSSPTLALLPPATLLLVLQHLQQSLPSLDRLPLPDVAVLVRTYADSPPDAADKALVELVSSLLLTRLQDLPQPRGDAVLTYKPPDIIHAAFAFVEKLLKLSEDKLALKIFQILVNSGNIPSEAVQTIPGLDGFASIVRSSLVRASTHWHWRPWAERFLSPLLESSPSPSTISLTVDTIYTCLNDPTVADLRACRSLIFQIHPSSPVPNGILRQFYNAAEQIDAGEEAHALYSFTRSEEVLKTHRYPCPRATALPWLLRFLLRINSHLAKELGEEVFVGNLPIPLEFRARIVEGLASRGHATLARGLWGKYAIGKDRETFVRDSSLMLRMVSLFHHLVKREEDVIAKKTKAGKSEIADDDFILHRQQADDFREFMDFVWSEFSQAHSPLSEASHQVLTSQARAYFIVGEFVRGFDTLKILLDRREMPDIYDINVTLTVMAQHSPRTAANIIQRMIERGLQPDHITYGTVMHHALNHGDMELVEEMVQRVRMLKNTHLSYKSIVSLVRGSIAFRPDSRVTQRSKLRSVFGIIRSIGRPTVLATPHLGKYLVSASLRGDDPIMAYRFWEFLLKENALWVDREQVHLRRLVVECLQRHQKAGWVKEHHARAMIAQLRARDAVQQRSN